MTKVFNKQEPAMENNQSSLLTPVMVMLLQLVPVSKSMSTEHPIFIKGNTIFSLFNIYPASLLPHLFSFRLCHHQVVT